MSSFSFLKKTRRGFSLVEMGMVIGVGAVAAGIAVPVFMNYQYSSDLHVAVANITQGIGEAKILAQSSKNDSAWGFSVTNGVVFQGESYATRQAGSDEFFPVPPTVAASGLLELFFTKMDGTVSRTGVILLMAKNGNKIAITIDNFGIATAGEATSSAIAMAGSDYSSVASAGGGDSSAPSGLSVSAGEQLGGLTHRFGVDRQFGFERFFQLEQFGGAADSLGQLERGCFASGSRNGRIAQYFRQRKRTEYFE